MKMTDLSIFILGGEKYKGDLIDILTIGSNNPKVECHSKLYYQSTHYFIHSTFQNNGTPSIQMHQSLQRSCQKLMPT